VSSLPTTHYPLPTLKVAHVITRLIIGGAQENTLLTVEDQRRDYGDEVVLITGPGLGPEGSLEERARRNGVPELRRSLHPARDWSSYRQLVRVLRAYRPEIVHTHSSKAGVMGRAAAAKLGIPAVHTIHGAAFHYGQNPLLHRLYIAAERWAARHCARLISVADAMTEQYVAAGIAPREKFVTIHSGMEVEPFLSPPRAPAEVREELGLRPEHVVIGKVARLFHLKGHEFVLRAAPRVIAANPHVRFLFVGDGILREQYERQIAAMGLRDHFVFAGLVPPQRVPELIHAMDVVVHTSLWEGLARVLPQALIAGKPVVSYDVDGAREVCRPGETGYLLPPQSVDELAAALTELAGDRGLRERFGATGRTRFTEPFRHETMTRRIRQIYQDVLTAANRRSEDSNPLEAPAGL
jgi:glycosyltransferase involved in cell wall biosynthesis